MGTQTFVVMEDIPTPRNVVVDSVKFLSVDPKRFSASVCTACHRPIGGKLPIAVVFAEGRGWRLCYECSKGLMEE